MSTKKEEVKATSVEETKVEEVVTELDIVAEESNVKDLEPSKTEEPSKSLETVNPEIKKEVSFYDDANREVSEEEATFLTDELITKIKNSHVYNEVMSYKKQLVIKYGDLEVVYSNEKAKELLK